MWKIIIRECESIFCYPTITLVVAIRLTDSLCFADVSLLPTNAGSGVGFQIICNDQGILNSGGGDGGAFDELHKEVPAGVVQEWNY